MNLHEFYIKRCLQIAKNGLGITRPNPSVGAVIVLNNKIIGEGFTSVYGKNHAEVNAIQAVKKKKILKEATLYVTLEPCSHFGKTPPCADLISKYQIKNVVIGCLDTNSLVSGKGVKRLKNSGVNVLVGVLENQCREHHKRFFTNHEKKRPYILLKWAETKNGFLAPLKKNAQNPIWISNQYSRQLVHQLRSKEQAILVGTNTVLEDNPKLNARSWFGENPVRIVLDKSMRIPDNLAIYDGSVKTIILTDLKQSTLLNKKNTIVEKIDFSKNVAQQVCDTLYRYEIQSVIIEGGLQTIQTFIDENLWDEAYVYVGSVEFKKGLVSPKIMQDFVETSVQNDILKIYKND